MVYNVLSNFITFTARIPLRSISECAQCAAAVWPVRKTEASVSFFHLLLELLDTVQKGHHGVVEFIVPEEPQATWAIQRKFLDKHKTERKSRIGASRSSFMTGELCWKTYSMYYLGLVGQWLQVRVVSIRDETISEERKLLFELPFALT